MILTARISSSDRKTTCTPRAFKLRKAKSVSDFEAVAALCASAFASSGSISDINQSQSDSAIAQIVRLSLGVVLPGSSSKQPTDDLFERLIELDRRKKEAQEAQHAYLASKQELRSAIDQAREEGRQDFADDLELLLYERRQSERRKLLQWRFKRQSMVIIAEDRPDATAVSTSAEPQLAGSCAVVLKILDSFLPPPFPTRQPARLYIGNLVVRESKRRQGCGLALLQAVDTLGRRWRHKEVWLHVDIDNEAAVAMYRKAGFVTVKRERERVPPFHMRYLMKKSIPRAAAPSPPPQLQISPAPHSSANLGPNDQGAALQMGDKKVFVWEESDSSDGGRRV